MGSTNRDYPPLWIDASNLREGGGVTHLVEVAPRLADMWTPERITIFAGKNERQALRKRSSKISLPEIPELDAGLSVRLRWQLYGLPVQVSLEDSPGIVWALGGMLSKKYTAQIATVTMCQNMLPFEWREAVRYGASWMLLRLGLLRIGQARSFRQADGVIFLSEYARNHVGRLLPSEVLQTIIPHGVGETFRLAPDVPKIAAPPRKLLYLSKIEVYKHQDKVIEALKELVDRGYDLALDLVGGSYAPAQKRLAQAIKRTQMHDRVRLVGEVQYDDVPAAYQCADIVVFASSCENLPNILLEAMASGVPIACSNRGPMPEVAQDAAVFFDPEAPHSIADAVEKLLQSRDLRQEKAFRAHEIASRYSWDRCAEQTAAFLYGVWQQKQRQFGCQISQEHS